MARKLFSGAEVKAFWQAWQLDEVFYVDEQDAWLVDALDRLETDPDAIANEAKVPAEALGIIFRQDFDREPRGENLEDRPVARILERWLEDQQWELITVKVEKSAVGLFRHFAKLEGWRIVR